MSIQEVFDLLNNVGVDFDGYYGDQCVDWVQIINRLYKAPLLTGDASDIWNTYPTDFYTRIDNTPDAVPQLGDIVIWEGPPGHIAVATGQGDTNTFTSVDQNFPTGSFVHVQNHNYDNPKVLGWLRPKQLPQDLQSQLDVIRKARDDNWNLYQEEVSKNTDITKQLQDEQIKSQSLREANDKLTQADADTGVQLLDAQHQRDDLTVQLHSVSNALQCPQDINSILSAIDTLKKPIDAQIKPLQDHALSLQNAFETLVYKRVPKKTQNILSKLFSLFWQ